MRRGSAPVCIAGQSKETPETHSRPAAPSTLARSDMLSPGRARLDSVANCRDLGRLMRAMVESATPGPTSRNTARLVRGDRRNALCKLHSPTKMATPVAWRRRFPAGDPGAGDVRDVGNARRSESLTPSSSRRNSGSAGSIMAEWKACEVLSSTTSIPACLSRCRASAICAFWPAIAQSDGALTAAISTRSPTSGSHPRARGMHRSHRTGRHRLHDSAPSGDNGERVSQRRTPAR